MQDESTLEAGFSKEEEVRLLFYDRRFAGNNNHVSSCYEIGSASKSSLKLLKILIENCEYLKLLKDAKTRMFLEKCIVEGGDDVENSQWSLKIKSWCTKNTFDEDIETQYLILIIGVSALQLFVQCNWTGPMIEDTAFEILPFLSEFYKFPSLSHKHAISELSVGVASAYRLIRLPELLLLARILLIDCMDVCKSCFSSSWWRCRCLIIQQHILSERSPLIYSHIKDELEKIPEIENILESCGNISAHVQLHLEAARYVLHYHEVLEARKHLELVQKLLGLEVELSGSLGKRTHFQQKAVSQLLVIIKTNSNRESDNMYTPVDVCSFPVDVKLDDDTILNKTKFENENDNVPELLHPEEQAVVLSLCQEIKRSQADHALIHEELMAYIQNLLSHPSVWSVQIQCLLLRCKLEKQSSRRVERSLKQLQVLIDSVEKKLPVPLQRFFMFYCIIYPAVWDVEKELAELLASLGDIKSALEIFTRLEMWEEIVTCYIHLRRKDRAEAIIRKQLDEEETPLMWCLLGDVTDNPDYYLKAWELSDHRSSRAQRSLGMLHFRKGEYDKCIPYFQKSLEINSLQEQVWFSLAYASMQVEDYQLCATAYRRVVNLDPDNFEAWNNLSNAYVKTKQKQRSWYALQEALKYSYENWRIWENYLLVSADIGAFDEAIRAWHRLIDTKNKHLDDEILAILVEAVTTKVTDLYGEPATKYRKKLLELMGRIMATGTGSAQAWRLYAQLLLSDPETKENPVSMQKVAQYLQKAHRCVIQQVGWEKECSQCKTVLSHTKELAEVYLNCSECFTDTSEILKLLSSAKLSICMVLTMVSKHMAECVCEDVDNIKSIMNTLESTYQEIVDKIKQSTT